MTNPVAVDTARLQSTWQGRSPRGRRHPGSSSENLLEHQPDTITLRRELGHPIAEGIPYPPIVLHGDGTPAWGYGGSGPADLALNVLVAAGASREEAEGLLHEAKWKFVAPVPYYGGRIQLRDVREFLAQHREPPRDQGGNPSVPDRNRSAGDPPAGARPHSPGATNMAEAKTSPSPKPAVDSPSRYYGKFAETAIRQMEAGTAPWQRGSKTGEPVLPRNAITGRAYTGGNSVYLASRGQDRGFTDNRWMTMDQIKKAAAQPPKGPGERVLVRDERKGQKPVWRTSIVYNVEQVKGLKLPPRRPRPYWQAHNNADAVIAASEVEIKTSPGDQAYYAKDRDQVVLPRPAQFRSPEHYYSTAIRNMAHASGHESRMDRETFKQTHSEGLEGAAHGREKMRTEIATMTVADRLGVGYEPNADPSYKELWIKALKEDPREIHRAASEGHRIARNLMRPARDALRDIAREARTAMQASTERDPHEIPNPRPTPQRQAPAMSPGR